MPEISCPSCGNDDTRTIGKIEYTYDHPARYDGPSEYYCGHCTTRWGRWTGNVLKDGQWEWPFGIQRTR